MSTIGQERRFNPFLQHQNLDEFRAFLQNGTPPEPRHYRRLKQLNAAGPPVLGEGAPSIPGLPAEDFRGAIDEAFEHGGQLVDTRSMLAFGGGHIDRAINIGPRPSASVWAGQMLDPDRPLFLVIDEPEQLDELLWLYVNTGFTRFSGYLVGGMRRWAEAGLPVRPLSQMTVHELHDQIDDLQVLDVRSPAEWQDGHVPGARHCFVADLHGQNPGCEDLDPDRPTAVYCGSGYRASLAASLLQSRGIEDVRNVVGSWTAWNRAGYPVAQ